MTGSLVKRFLLVLLLFIVSSFLLTSSIGTYCVRNYFLNKKVHTLTAISDNFSSLIAASMDQDNIDTLFQLDILNLFYASDDYTVWIIDNDRIIQLSSDNRDNIQIPFDPLLKTSYFPGTYNSYLKEDTISVYSPIILKNTYQPVGYALVHYPYSQIQAEGNTLLRWIYVIWGACILVSILCCVLLYQGIARPTRKMIRMINDEQKQFIANVSHDLRSPLTSIKGYLEAIQDGTIPPELEGKYINIVLNETNRLADLTRNLLTITSLNSNQDSLQRTSFDINSVIRQILLTFEQRCQKRGIHFNLTFANHTQFVYADLIKIQQVLYNLIDNAIKFSPDQSVIEIKTTLQYNKLFVSILDHGSGIPEESITKIWNRFYKIDSSRGRDKKGLGLGLAIVHNIIKLHGETIHVNSSAGNGSEFIFSLPVA